MFAALAFVMSIAAAGADPHAAEAIADSDRIVAVHEGPGVVVVDLDRSGEMFQLTMAVDDDGRVTDSDLDWVGPTPRTATVGG